jgi:nickel/cobalt transporter (NicO) family protein
VTATVPALLATAGGVGFAHSVLPDHWLPLAVTARARHDPLPRVARLSLFAGAAHVAVSVVLGGVVIAVGLSLRSVIESRADLIVGGVLVLTGVVFLVLELTGHGHHHHHDHDDHDHDDHDHDHDHDHDDHRPVPKGLGLLIPFGAAASPDLTILPVFLAAATVGAGAAIGSLIVFTIITVGTFVALTTLAAAGSYQLTNPWLDRYANRITAVVLIVIGALVAVHVL